MPVWERSFEGHTHYVYSVQYSPDGLQIVTASFDKTAKLWSVATAECVATLEYGSDVYGVVAGPDFVAAQGESTTKMIVWRPA